MTNKEIALQLLFKMIDNDQFKRDDYGKPEKVVKHYLDIVSALDQEDEKVADHKC